MSFYCKNCEKFWSYPLKRCIYCGESLQEVIETVYEVIGSTEVKVPSTEHEKVPYFNYLLEDKNGNKIIIKSFGKHEIGDIIDLTEEKADKNNYKVGVIGTGQMGMGIAEYILRDGHKIILKTRNNSDKATSYLKKRLSRDHTDEQLEIFMENLDVSLDFNSLKNCDIIIEAVSEDFELKKHTFMELSNVCGSHTIFATNTSSISIDKLAKITDRPEKFIGMHFFNPVSRMDLIEVVVGKKTSDETRDVIIAFSEELEKIPVVVKDSPGFIVNRLLLPQINEAVHLAEDQVAKKEDIDRAMKLGLNHPMGPFQLADFIGIDICVSILQTIYNELEDEKFKPAKTLIEMVDDGKLGLKSGEGFYKYK